jgi:hypothetical protein
MCDSFKVIQLKYEYGELRGRKLLSALKRLKLKAVWISA